MLTSRYMASLKNLDAILKKMIEGAPPDRFTVEHLKSLGFKGSNDRGIVALLKDLGFLTSEGAPTERYHQYRDKSQSRRVMGQALRQAYSDVFHVSENPKPSDRPAIEGVFKTKKQSTDRVATQQAATFLALLKHADLDGISVSETPEPEETDHSEPLAEAETAVAGQAKSPVVRSTLDAQLHYTIQIHLPATKDIDVYNSIFRSLKESLLS